MTQPGPAPYVPGFAVTWDPLTDQWIATSPSGRFQIRGRDRAELDRARWELWSEQLAHARSVLAEVFPRGRTA